MLGRAMHIVRRGGKGIQSNQQVGGVSEGWSVFLGGNFAL